MGRVNDDEDVIADPIEDVEDEARWFHELGEGDKRVVEGFAVDVAKKLHGDRQKRMAPIHVAAALGPEDPEYWEKVGKLVEEVRNVSDGR